MISLHFNKKNLIGKSEEEITHLLQMVENKWFVYERDLDIKEGEAILREIFSSLTEAKDFVGGFIKKTIKSPCNIEFMIQKWKDPVICRTKPEIVASYGIITKKNGGAWHWQNIYD